MEYKTSTSTKQIVNMPDPRPTSLSTEILTEVTQDIKWVEKEQKIYNKAKNKLIKLKFLRLNFTHKHNHGMGHVNISNQLCNHYRIDHWLQTYKWWHAIFWWCFQVLLVNFYRVYCCFLEDSGVNPLLQYN